MGVTTKSGEERSLFMQIFDILFIFVVAGVCVVTPVILQGTVLVGWGETGGMQFVWDPVAYFSLLAVILVFFIVILYHSVRNYKF
ncbi:formate hydrogenlyase subunit 3/multisubunit Na+/H+ antiporter MnhD subunit [Methanohalophilus levihalophilus]|uniref:AcrB/AcrD/AcrF family protein n=1 Tax=Methanohalophilus levihalophilus TaxID=1431282 RepID=UPI001AE790A2|nr:AcrB/AcrD/AcrF family protein [Methanohalophilus levihalophilus]MBP2029786.1 formate hydrogenlyase subunit 3/multisubunit Na+/H+ antiporter MnhD subunit [Methanohalophilus levihalophilus]